MHLVQYTASGKNKIKIRSIPQAQGSHGAHSIVKNIVNINELVQNNGNSGYDHIK